MMIRSIVIELDLSDKFESYALMIDFSAWFLELYVNGTVDVLAVVID